MSIGASPPSSRSFRALDRPVVENRVGRLSRVFPLLSLGASIARRGPMAIMALIVCAITALVTCGIGLSFARRGGDAPVHAVPILAASALAWGGGFLLAFSAAASALRRDRTDGIRHLFVTRTTSMRGYLVARLGGLAWLLFVVIGSGTLLTGAVSIIVATRAHTVLKTIQATGAGLVFALAFSIVIACLAFAALGARTRMSGYGWMLAILIVPEIVASIAGSVPSEVTELIALPSALGAIRTSLAPGSVDFFRLVRGLVAIAVYVGGALIFVRRELALLEYDAGVDA